MLVIFAALAEVERDTMLLRSSEGIVAAKNRRVIFGRPRTANPKRFDHVVSRRRAGKFTATEAHRMLGLSRSTFYRLVATDRDTALVSLTTGPYTGLLSTPPSFRLQLPIWREGCFARFKHGTGALRAVDSGGTTLPPPRNQMGRTSKIRCYAGGQRPCGVGPLWLPGDM